MTQTEQRIWSSPIAHAIDDFLDERQDKLEIDDLNTVYLAQRIIEIAYLQKELEKSQRNKELLEQMLKDAEEAETEEVGEDNENE